MSVQERGVLRKEQVGVRDSTTLKPVYLAVEPQFLKEEISKLFDDIDESLKRELSHKEIFKHLRFVVLLKSNDLSEIVVFEFGTVRYDHELYKWEWNTNNNLVGTHKKTGEHCFTWQPHRSQFTTVEDVSEKCLVIKIKQPKTLDKDQILKALGFDKSWVTVT